MPPWRWHQIELLYPRWRNRLDSEATAPTQAEWDYLEKALTKTFFVDGDRMDFLKQVALNVAEDWIAAEGNPALRRQLRKADFRIR